MDEVKPAARLPTVEHREPCELRGSRTVLGAPGGEIPPGDLSVSSVAVTQQVGGDRSESGHRADTVDRSKMTHLRHWARLVEHWHKSQSEPLPERPFKRIR